MFSAYCDHTATNHLMGTRSVRSLTNTTDGVVFGYECVCGAAARYDAARGIGRHEASVHADLVA